MSNIILEPKEKIELFEFELEINRVECHRFNVIAKNHDEASQIVDKHDFGFGDVSRTNYSVNKMDRKPTTKYTESRIINYSFLVYNDDESNENESVESNLIQLQGWQAIVKENKTYNLNYDINNDQIIS